MLRVRDVMTTDVISISPELTLRDTIELFAQRHISGAPVLASGRLVGVLSTSDVLSFESSTPVVPVGREDQVELDEWEVPGEWEEGAEAPATYFNELWADAGADVLERFNEVRGPEWDLLAEHTVGEAMSRSICAVSTETEVSFAAGFMTRAGIHRLLVREAGQLVGIITSMDIVKAVAQRRLVAARAPA